MPIKRKYIRKYSRKNSKRILKRNSKKVRKSIRKRKYNYKNKVKIGGDKCGKKKNLFGGDNFEIKELERNDGTKYKKLFGLKVKENKEGIEDQDFKKQMEAKCTEIEIPNGVGTVGTGAFKENEFLNSVNIPSSVYQIETETFMGCSKLKSVTFESKSNLRKILNNAFRNCTSLTSITIPDGVTHIGNAAFYGCDLLESVSIPKSITDSVVRSAFPNRTKVIRRE